MKVQPKIRPPALRFRRRAHSVAIVLASLALALGSIVVGPISTATALSNVTSDEFDAAALDQGVWSVVDPNGAAQTSVGGGTLKIALPSGASNDAWPNNQAARVVQQVSDVDFAVDTQFATVPSLRFQDEGVLVAQDSGRWLRFDVYHDGKSLHAFAGRTANGANTVIADVAITTTSSTLAIRVVRSATSFAMQWSPDGATWRDVTTFTDTLAVSTFGVYAANSQPSSTKPAPAWSAAVDYVRSGPAPTSTTGTGTGATTSTGGGSFVSDDFSQTPLASRWNVVDPVGGAQVGLVGQGTSDAQLAITLPGGSDRDAWGTNNSTRVLQSIQDADLTLEVKFDSLTTARFQDQGLVVQQSPSRWLRFSVYSDGSRVYAFAASTTDNTSTVQLKKAVSASASTWVRVARQGSTWTMQYSKDGSTFAGVGSFADALTPTAAGPYAGVGGSAGSEPPFTALVDYVFDTSSRVTPEDGAATPDSTPPTVSNLSVTPGSVQAVVSWSTDELSTGRVQLATGSGPYVDAGTTASLSTSQSVTLTGLSPSTDYAARVIASDASGNTVTTSGTSFRTTMATGPQIDVWLGDDEVFGAHGTTQPWVNLLGNVSDPDGVQSLRYTLNGGGSRSLTLGPDNRRLQYPGDFNADIKLTDLVVGANTVVLTAVDKAGSGSTRTVTVRREAVTPPDMAFTQTWSQTEDLDAQVSVVDGHWTVGPDGVRVAPGATGYDRVLALGDQSWTDFEVTVPVTMHSFGPAAGSYLSGAPLVGLAMRWQGHQAVNSAQPAWGYKTVGAYAWFRWYDTPKLEMVGNDGSPKVGAVGSWPVGATYVLKARAVTGPSGTTYSFKTWPQGAAEPASWTLSFTQNGPTHGSVALIAHQLDATFGTVSVRPL